MARFEGITYKGTDIEFEDLKAVENAAEAFSTSQAYATGDYCTYEGTLYKFVADHSAGAWNAAQVKKATIGREITDLKSALNDNTIIDVALHDGYISNGGDVMPPTADAQKYSDFIPVVNGATVEVSVTLSQAKYRNIGIFGYTSEKTFVAILNRAEGSSLTQFALSAKVNDATIKYVRFSFNAYNVLTNCIAKTYVNGSSILEAVDEKLLSEIGALTHIDLTNSLVDGYIASTNGTLMPQTSDKQKATDYIPVSSGAMVNALLILSASKYRSIGVYGYDNEKNYIGIIASVEGGLYDRVVFNNIIENQSVFFIRFSFSTHDVLTSFSVDIYSTNPDTLRTVDEKIGMATTPIRAEVEIIKSLSDIAFQYIDTSLWESGYYNWNQSHTALVKNDGGANWFCMKVVDIPAGTYKYNKFCSLPFSFIENISTGEIENLQDIGVIETNNGTVTIGYDFNLWLSISNVYFDKSITMFADGGLPSEYVYGWYKDTAASNYVNAQGQTVWIVGNGYIPTIQAACDAASPNDIIFVRVGTYTEQVSIWNKKLHIIGENKANTILIDHSGAYNTPPLEMSLGSLSNMTIIEDGTQPTLQPGESGYNGAYCLHIEWTPPANEVFLIENCDFINYVHSPLGCGLYQDYTVHFKDCTFRCEATDEGNMERGSFYFHSNIHPNVTGQKIIAENCIISSAGQRWAVLLGVPAGANNTGSAEARFSGCTIWNDNVGTADSIAYFDTSGGADVLKVVHSCGNTVDILNNW